MNEGPPPDDRPDPWDPPAGGPSPQRGAAPWGVPGGSRADDPLAIVQGPATALLVSGILSGLTAVGSLLANLLGTSLSSIAATGGSHDAWMNMFSGVAGIVGCFFNLSLAGLVIAGATKMRRLENHALAMAAAVITVIPCTTCCLWGLPIGLWAVSVLSRPEVKAAFTVT